VRRIGSHKVAHQPGKNRTLRRPAAPAIKPGNDGGPAVKSTGQGRFSDDLVWQTLPRANDLLARSLFWLRVKLTAKIVTPLTILSIIAPLRRFLQNFAAAFLRYINGNNN
jgi:hypothetical protein